MDEQAVRHALPDDAEEICAIYNAAIAERGSRDVVVVERLLTAPSPAT